MSLSPAEIAALEEMRQAESTVAAAETSLPIAGGFMSRSGVGSWTNQACGLGLAGPVTAEEVDRLDRFYAEHGIEPKIEVCPFSDPSLLTQLAARGFVLREFEAVLAYEPGEVVAEPLHGWPAGIEVVRIDRDDPAQVEAFIDASSCGFRPEDAPVPPELEASLRRLLKSGRFAGFVALDRGQAVGGAGVDIGRGVACLAGASVRRSHRGRGIQQALINARVRHAREVGCAVICVHSRPGIPTERNAVRLGFALVYHKVALVRPGPGLAASP